jgi:hypothetical protein
MLEKSEGAPESDDSRILHGSTRDLDRFGLAFMVANADLREVQPSGVDAHERGESAAVVGAAPDLAEGTAGVELVGEAERAVAAKSEAFYALGADVKWCLERCPLRAN